MGSRIQDAATRLIRARTQKGRADAMKYLEEAVRDAERDRSGVAIAYAREHLASDELEVDDDAITSESGDGGTWVAAWVYVPV